MMQTTQKKKAATLMKRRKIAIVCMAVAFAILLGVYVGVKQFMKPTIPYIDADGTRYNIRYSGGAYAMYDTDGNLLATDGEYGYYVTAFGSLIELDAQTGATLGKVIVDDLEDGEDSEEVTSTDVRVLMFPHVEQKQILEIEVSNANGKYTLAKLGEDGQLSPEGSFSLRNAPTVQFDPEKFPMIYTAAGYTIATQKIKDPIKNENGEYSEYGLVPETRVDDEGNEYQYTPAYFVLTETSGEKHKVILGDMLVSGRGYYAQYVDIGEDGKETKRDAVYVLNPTTTASLYAPIEQFVYPLLTYPMEINNYFDVENFTIVRKDGESYEELVNFTYVDIADRENTIEALFPYVFNSILDGYRPSSESIDPCLQAIYEPDILSVKKVLPADRNYYRTLAEYGFYRQITDDKGETDYEISADYIISYDFDITDDEGNFVETINNFILFSGPNEDGNYYAHTSINSVKGEGDKRDLKLLYSYDLILELDGDDFEFLNYDRYKWISRYYFELNIAYCDKFTLTAPDYSATFDLDNSASDNSTMTKSDRLTVSATDSLGNTKKTFGGLSFKDKSGYDWVITGTSVTVYQNGEAKRIVTSYYDHNAMGQQVLCLKGYIEAQDHSKIYVTADTVKINRPDGSVEEYVRYDTELFRKYFQTFLNATIVDSYELDEEEEAALIGDPSKLLLTLEMTDTEGKTVVYKFYSLTSRKAYITVNGNGGFYVLPGRLEKFVSDAQRFFNNEIIDPTARS